MKCLSETYLDHFYVDDDTWFNIKDFTLIPVIVKDVELVFILKNILETSKCK